MLNTIRRWFSTTTAAPVAFLRPAVREPMLAPRLAAAIALFLEKSWNLKDATKEAWGRISPVKVTTKFMGYGFVAGRQEAFKVNSRVNVTEADDDMDFSEYCVIVDGTPCLLIKRKGSSVGVTIIAERDFLEQVFNTSAMRCNSYSDFKAMPEPVQKIMHDVLEKVLMIHEARAKSHVEPIEKMLTY